MKHFLEPIFLKSLNLVFTSVFTCQHYFLFFFPAFVAASCLVLILVTDRIKNVFLMCLC